VIETFSPAFRITLYIQKQKTIKQTKKMERKTFLFYEKNGSGTLTFSAFDFDDAIFQLEAQVKEPLAWRCDNEEGEEE
jgi:hypothetical protein